MIPSNQPATIVTLVAAGVSALIAIAAAFHLIQFTPDQQTAVVDLAVIGVGTGLLVYAWLRSWSTDTYNVSQVTAGLVSSATVVLGFLNAFNIFHATETQQASLTGICGLLALAGAYVFAALHTKKTVQLKALRAAEMQTTGATAPGERS